MTTKWTKKMESRFSHLAAMEAFGIITPEELHELNELSEKRSLSFPETKEQMRKSNERRRKINTLIDRIGIDRI